MQQQGSNLKNCNKQNQDCHNRELSLGIPEKIIRQANSIKFEFRLAIFIQFIEFFKKYVSVRITKVFIDILFPVRHEREDKLGKNFDN